MLLVSPILQMVALNGIAIRMEAGVEMDVRESLVMTALAQGCTKVGAKKAAKVKNAPETDPTLDALAQVVEEGNPDNFGRDGTPKVKAIEKVLGYDISAADRDVAWNTFQEV
jgi:hypothetical protein